MHLKSAKKHYINGNNAFVNGGHQRVDRDTESEREKEINVVLVLFNSQPYFNYKNRNITF